MRFYKYQGTGNDFIIIDNRQINYNTVLGQKEIARLCNRNWGIGADGLMLFDSSVEADFRMTYYNSDGLESSMCGNGGRCMIAFAKTQGLPGETYTFEAIDGLHQGTIREGRVVLEMNTPHGYREIPRTGYSINTGSPHLVRFSDIPVDEVNVYAEGKYWRNHPLFAPQGLNVNFVQVLDDASLKVRTFERGVENETLSCGTGVTACAYVYLSLSHWDRREISIHTHGGDLKVYVENPGLSSEKVLLEGPADFVFSGEIDIQI